MKTTKYLFSLVSGLSETMIPDCLQSRRLFASSLVEVKFFVRFEMNKRLFLLTLTLLDKIEVKDERSERKEIRLGFLISQQNS